VDELTYEIDFFTTADAPGVVALFREVYGEHYPVKAVYDPDMLILQEQTGDAYRMVARSPTGDVVGHVAAYRSTPPNPDLYEIGCLMVSHIYRQTDLAFALFTAQTNGLVQRYHIGQVWGEAVCNHLFTQQSINREGVIETGLEMDLMPASSYYAPGSQSVGGRVSVLPCFRLMESHPRIMYLPSCYDEFIRYLYEPFNQECTFLPADPAINPVNLTSGQVQTFSEAGVTRITLEEIGSDFEDWMRGAILAAEKEGSVVIQLFMKMTSPYTGYVVNFLQKLGFFFGAILPCWFGDDGFLMQKIVGEPFFAGTHVYSKRAKKIKEYVQNDWQIRNSR
jgi:hypothetical protein